MGPVSQGTPHVIETKTEPAALLDWRGQSSTAVSSPAVTSSPRDLRDLAHRLSYSVGLLVGAMHGGGAHGRAVALDDGATPVEATAAPTNAMPSIYGLQGSYCSRYRGLRWSGWAWPRRRRVAEELRRGVARHWGLPSLASEHGREQWVAEKMVEFW